MSKQTELMAYRKGFVDALDFFAKDSTLSNLAGAAMAETRALRYLATIVKVPDETTTKTIRSGKTRKRKSTVQTVRETVPATGDGA